MSLLKLSDTTEPGRSPKPPRGWRFNHSQGRLVTQRSPSQAFTRAFQLRRHQRNLYLAGLAFYWKHGSPLTMSIYAAFAAAYNPWRTWSGRHIALTDYQAFIAMNEYYFQNFIAGIYSPRTDTPWSETWTLPNSPRINFSNPRITGTGFTQQFWLDIPAPHVPGFWIAAFYAPGPAKILTPGRANPPAFVGQSLATAGSGLGTTIKWPLAAAFNLNPLYDQVTPNTVIIRPNNGEYIDPGPPPTAYDSPPLDQLYYATFPGF